MYRYKEVDESILLETLSLFGEDVQKIVVVGGWCPYLYKKYLWKVHTSEPPRTTDIDFGVYETGSKRFTPTIYERLIKAGYGTERIYDEDSLPVEFIYKDGSLQVKVEFITSFEVSDDTLQRFLGPEIACHRIEGFELLLRSSAIPLTIPHRSKDVTFNVLAPEIYFFHKGITFPGRVSEEKKSKDMQYIYFILKSCPGKAEFLDNIFKLKGHDYFPIFRENILTNLGDISCPGYPALAEMLGFGYEAGYREIESVFRPLVEVLRN